jgi:hypothetical protein
MQVKAKSIIVPILSLQEKYFIYLPFLLRCAVWNKFDEANGRMFEYFIHELTTYMVTRKGFDRRVREETRYKLEFYVRQKMIVQDILLWRQTQHKKINTSKIRERILSNLSVNNAWGKIQFEIYFSWSAFLGGRGGSTTLSVSSLYIVEWQDDW